LNSTIDQLFQQQREAFYKIPSIPISHRRQRLKELKKLLPNYIQPLREAMMKDFRKPAFEVDSTEMLIVLRSLDTALRNLNHWNATRIVDSDILLPATNSYVKPEPKGMVLILAPWNYPFNLCFEPLISAFAGGNRIFLKPSEMAMHTAKLIEEIIQKVFQPDEVCCVQGGADVGIYLSGLDFDHLFFTGSKRVGSLVMQAAAKKLCTVTLELGGKNPVIVDKSYPMDDLIAKILHPKFLNAGQTCIASDYLILPASELDHFVERWNLLMTRWFPDNWKSNEEYSGMINQAHYDRILKLVEECIHQGAKLEGTLDVDEKSLRIKPVLLLNSDFHHGSMQEEIFGPVLPVICYQDQVDELFPKIKRMERPLSLYIFSKRISFIQKVSEHLRSGGMTVNNTLLNYCESNLPFGGDKHSGHGSTHGLNGFRTFVHLRSVSQQKSWLNILRLFYPPYTQTKQNILKWILKYYS